MTFTYMVGIPCLFGANHTRMAIDSVADIDGVELFLIDNGAEQSVKDVLNEFAPQQNVAIFHNEKNIYVNGAWNQILQYFLSSDCDYLIIMNSDLVLNKCWVDVLDKYFTDLPNTIPVPTVMDSPDLLDLEITEENIITELKEGIAGVCIILNKKHAEKIYPIPETIRVWFGDNYIFDKLRNNGYKTFAISNLIAYHYHNGSQNVQRVEGISEIIEQDKIEWEKIKHLC